MADDDRNDRTPAESTPGARNPVIVTIGASAGGVSALQRFFDALPERTGATFVVVVHLDPDHRSELPEILAGRTRMPVMQVNKTEKLKADHVYVIPPDRRVTLIDHEISPTEFEEPRGKRSPIDIFFRSAAERVGDGFAIILSGAGSDGSLGVRAVKEAGGIILVQDPQEAEYASMPRAAIESGVADFVLPVRDLAARLVELIRIKSTARPPEEPEIDEELLRRILAHLRVRTGHDFSKYKRSTVLRRIARRMQVMRTGDMREYLEILRENADEAQALLSDLLISVTTFFRDHDAYEALRTQVLPSFFRERDLNDTIRVWVSGCATGEEAYSIAMLLAEEAAKHEFHPSIQMFASDLDARALTVGREGRYPPSIEADVSEERLRRFFLREGEGYRVRQELRDMILFAVHDLLKDPPFSHVDVISCRNVLIYLDRDLQDQVCNTFHYALNPGGFLLLGSSESADSPSGLFRTIDRNARLYKSLAQTGDKPRYLPRLLGPVGAREHIPFVGRHMSPSVALSEAALHRRILERVAPPSVLVDDMHRVIHLSENAGRYFQPSGGSLSGDVVDLARPELRFELRSALHRFFEQRQPALSLPIMVRFNGAPRRVHLQVTGVIEPTETPQAIVMFIEGEAIDERFVSTDVEQANAEVVRRLQQELELTQSRLRTVREESDAANEELRAANEELQSINEEYRSTSEELETSKEELQSINEELQTVNTELKLKLEAISRAHSDLQNLLAATDFGTLFLDTNLRIKRFTERATDLFSITPSDEGRPISDFSHQLEYDELVPDIRKVLSDLAPVRKEIRSRSNLWFNVRMRPYRTVDNRIDGVVITFVDITERRHMEETLRNSARDLRRLKRLVELARAPILVWEFGDGILEWNRGCEELYGYSREEAVGWRKEQILHTEVPGSSYEELINKLREEGMWSGELLHRAKDGRVLTVEAVMQLETVEGRQLALQSMRDVTDRKVWEERQSMFQRELRHRLKNTLAVVQAIAHQTMRWHPTAGEFMERFDGRLEALGSAHGLLSDSNWEGIDLAQLVRKQLAPYSRADAPRYRADGEPIVLSIDLATPFGLVLHELATNAVKYGALSQPEGTILVKWSVKSKDGRRALDFTWEEHGIPSVPEAAPRGFGSALIQNAIPNAIVHREFHADSLVCTIEVPL
jgi:two-component system, chemotaxis family, CheB/CheR fusion protein